MCFLKLYIDIPIVFRGACFCYYNIFTISFYLYPGFCWIFQAHGDSNFLFYLFAYTILIHIKKRAFIFPQFRYCLLVPMFQVNRLDNRMNSISMNPPWELSKIINLPNKVIEMHKIVTIFHKTCIKKLAKNLQQILAFGYNG